MKAKMAQKSGMKDEAKKKKKTHTATKVGHTNGSKFSKIWKGEKERREHLINSAVSGVVFLILEIFFTRSFL